MEMNAPLCLVAQVAGETIWQWGRIQGNSDWLLPVGLFLAAAAYVTYLYWADCVELGTRHAVTLIGLRLVAIALLLIVYLQPEKRTQRKLTYPSRVAVLCDASGSMAASDGDDQPGGSSPRLERVKQELLAGKLIPALQARHEVSIAGFDREIEKLVTFSRIEANVNGNEDIENATDSAAWHNNLTPSGTETHLSAAVLETLQSERENPLAGIVIFSDGGQNGGVDPEAAAQLARDARVPVYAVGVGSTRRAANVGIRELAAPERVYPGDDFVVTALVEGAQMTGRRVVAELRSENQGSASTAAPPISVNQAAVFSEQDAVASLRFELPGIDRPGRYRFRVTLAAPSDDALAADNTSTFEVEAVDQETTVLLLAGGPSREYRFLRDQLYRDEHATVDVLLQSAPGEISQDARLVLSEFPSTPEELFAYDCVVAFDPDWRELSGAQLDLLEEWVAEQSGGLLLVAGPVYTDRWTQDRDFAKLRSLMPVEFQQRFTRFDSGRFSASEPQRVDFSEEGTAAEFLWLADDRSASEQAWQEFSGVFGFYEVKGAKPGATTYAYIGEEGVLADDRPIYMAGQFYGSGRTFFLGSGEIWRTRALDETYFEHFYTKLVRHLSQARLSRGAARGMLLVERERYRPGDTVRIRARLLDASYRPLTQPEVALEVLQPNSDSTALFLTADPTATGMYVGQFSPMREGAYEIVLPAPESRDDVLRKRFQVRLPDLEADDPRLNETLLAKLAAETGGMYYHGLNAIHGDAGVPALASQIKDRTRTTYVMSPPDRRWEALWFKWLLTAVVAALCLEWLLRRLWRLA